MRLQEDGSELGCVASHRFYREWIQLAKRFVSKYVRRIKMEYPSIVSKPILSPL